MVAFRGTKRPRRVGRKNVQFAGRTKCQMTVWYSFDFEPSPSDAVLLSPLSREAPLLEKCDPLGHQTAGGVDHQQIQARTPGAQIKRELRVWLLPQPLRVH